ncbi:hypothetical protein Ga0466249_003043 [Sporomusaceae bacterium BoRhaA]|jgi:hypothetical protein|uniref:hypothetical protein n=1 Tax=Pelorhabdus rhamnosifermentans TaxID=2772457 RepID=UPI001C063472|nr:hypothetical protein [Pelorhabdus rhamnosifermentans]MBU2701916.1 hypothetical protein [Pelorhabdus rhamnosifermentans]
MLLRMLNVLHDNWVGIILFMTLLTFFAWLFGYVLNGLYSYKFDLASCWAGFGAIATAAAAGCGRWWIDSRENSKQGEMPQGRMKE